MRIVEVVSRRRTARPRARPASRASRPPAVAWTLRARAGDRTVLKSLLKVSNSLSEAEGGGDGIGADERGGPIALPLEQRGQPLVPRIEGEDDIVGTPCTGG